MVILINFILAFILVRIYPIKHFEDKYIQENKTKKCVEVKPDRGRIKIADIGNSLKETVNYLVSISVQIVISYFVALILMDNTRIFTLLGKPLEWILNLLKIDGASIFAQTIVMGGIDVSLPALLIARSNVGTKIAIEVLVLSIVQIIFWTESIIAIRESKNKMAYKDLFILFLERSLIGLILVKLLVWMIW